MFCVDHEIEYFNHNYTKGKNWYREQFIGWTSESAVGEATPGYMFYPENTDLIASRVKKVLGYNVKLIAILRDPVFRARSAYIHHMRKGRIPLDADPLDYISSLMPDNDSLGIVRGGWYGKSLLPYFKLFPKGLLIEFYNDISTTPVEAYQRSLKHIGVRHDWSPSGLEKRLFSGVSPLQSELPQHRILSLSEDDLREVLSAHFRDDSALLSDLLDREVPWDT